MPQPSNIPKSSQNHPKITLKTCPNHLQVLPKPFPNYPRMMVSWCCNAGTTVVWRWCYDEPMMMPCWCCNGYDVPIIPILGWFHYGTTVGMMMVLWCYHDLNVSGSEHCPSTFSDCLHYTRSFFAKSCFSMYVKASRWRGWRLAPLRARALDDK